VFKFWFGAWWLTAIAAGVAAWWLLGKGRRAGRRPRPRTLVWLGAVAVAALLAVLYPVSAVPERVRDRIDPTAWTLDGMAFLPEAVYEDEHGSYRLGRDLEAIRWARAAIPGSPVILEGVTPAYRWGNRFSVYTGLPAVIGWDYHEVQQRGNGEEINRRVHDVERFYASPSVHEAQAVLRRYGVAYVFAGELERRYYGAAGVAKLRRMPALAQVYDRGGVEVYRVRDNPSQK
jgi:uncharacterized membrane protein